MKAIYRAQELGLAIGILLLAVIFQVLSHGQFVTSLQLGGVSSLASGLGMAALGVTVLMIAGEFDLSVSASFATAPIVMGTLMTNHGWGPFVALIAGLLVVTAIGLLNGIIVMVTGVQSFIVTLAMLFVVTSADRRYLGAFAVQLPDTGGAVLGLMGGRLPGTTISAPFVWFLGTGAVLWLVLGRMRYGNWVQASGYRGGEVARAMGVPVQLVKISCFALCSGLAGLAGCLQFAKFGFTSITSGFDYSLLAIAAAVIGGTSLFGTRGTVVGTVLGAILLAVLSPGLIVIGTTGNYFLGLTGALLLVAALANERAGQLLRGARSLGRASTIDRRVPPGEGGT